MGGIAAVFVIVIWLLFLHLLLFFGIITDHHLQLCVLNVVILSFLLVLHVDELLSML